MKRKIGPRYYGRKRVTDSAVFKQLKFKQRLTQETLAERADISLKVVQRAEQAQAIEMRSADAIAKALGVRLDELFTDAQIEFDGNHLQTAIHARRTIVKPGRITPSGTDALVQTGQALTSGSEPSSSSRSLIGMPCHSLPPDRHADSLGSSGTPKSQDTVCFERDSKTLWQAAKSIFLPINKEDLDSETGVLERVRRIEIPNAALEEAQAARPELVMPEEVHEFLRDLWSNPRRYHSIIAGHPALQAWLAGIWSELPDASTCLEKQQLKKFFRAMQFPEIDEQSLPDFVDEEVSCWRVFVQAFPGSIRLLEKVSLNENIPPKHRMAISLLASTLATAGDPPISMRAKVVARRLHRQAAVSRLYKYDEYRVVRQLLYSAAEAGEAPVQDVIDFLHRHPVEWEVKLHQKYYEDATDMLHARAVVTKCERPFERDLGTTQISLYQRDMLPKCLEEEAYRVVGVARSPAPSR